MDAPRCTRSRPCPCAGLTVALPLLGGCAPLATQLAVSREVALGGAAAAVAASALGWMGVRRGALPRWAPLAPLALALAMLARLPAAPARLLTAAVGLLEVAILALLVVRLPSVVRGARAARGAGPLAALQAGLSAARVPPRVAAIVAAELGVLWLVCTGWFRHPAPHTFSMRRTSWLAMAAMLGLLLVVESVAVHLLLARWSAVAAWLATASSAYALLWLCADAQAIRLYPHAIVADTLHLRLGVRWRAAIPLGDIASVEPIHAVPSDAHDLTLLDPSVLVRLHRPTELTGLLGRRRRTTALAVTVDDAERFVDSLRAVPAA
jgi:hypothetical protein